MDRLELKVPPLALFVACALLVFGLSTLGLASLPDVPGAPAVGVALLAVGALVAALGVVEFRRAGTTVNPMSPERSCSVVTTGVYRWSRNPMYLGMAIALAGLSLVAGTGAGLVLTFGFCAYLSRYQIVPEERRLLRLFGDPYARYLREVRRWL